MKGRMAMILYHLDRENSFPTKKDEQFIKPSKILNIDEVKNQSNQEYVHGISNHGDKYLSFFDENYDSMEETYNNFRIYTIEYIFEMVRRLYFPNLPSRFTSLFACKTKDEIMCWYDVLTHNKQKYPNITIKIISTDRKTLICDTYWRDGISNLLFYNDRSVFSPFAYHEYAINYWKGIKGKKPRMEVLCELPVTIIESIPYSDFISQ